MGIPAEFDVECCDKLVLISCGISNEYASEDEGEFKPEIINSLDNHPFMIQKLASRAITMYSNVVPDVVYRLINQVFGEELYDELPLMFPLTNLVGLGITNYYDVYGCLNLLQKRIDRIKNNPKARVKNVENAYKKD